MQRLDGCRLLLASELADISKQFQVWGLRPLPFKDGHPEVACAHLAEEPVLNHEAGHVDRAGAE
eukprot:12083277-Alexandrium_andersonii.AAC.1